MKYEFEELIDLEQLQKFTDSLFNAFGLPSAVITTEGKVLTKSGWQRLCTDFHRKNPITKKMCIESDIRILDMLKKGEKYAIYKCPFGLIDSSSPIIIKGEHVANVFAGQFFNTEPNEDTELYFREQAKNYGFDEELYISAFKETPVFSNDKHVKMLEILVNLADILSSIGIARIIELEKTKIIEDSQEKFSKAFYNHPTPMEIINIETGERIDVNRSFVELFGFSKKEFLGKNAHEHNIWIDGKARENGLQNWVVNRKLVDYPMDVRIKSGELKNLLVSGSTLNIGDGNLVIASFIDISIQKKHELLLESKEKENKEKIVELNNLNEILKKERFATFNILEDLSDEISERKNIELRLRESRELYKSVFKNSPVGIMHYNKEGICKKINDEFLKILDTTNEKIIEFNLIKRLKNKKMLNAVVRSLATGYGYYNDYYTSVTGNKTSAIIIRFKGIKNEKNEIIGGIAIAEDISELKKAETILRESEEKFKKAFHTNPDSININRISDGLYIEINNGFTSTTGYTREDVIGKTSIEIDIWTNYKDREKLVSGLRKDGTVNNFEAMFRKKNGDIIVGLMSASIIEVDNESCILSITRDISDIKQIQNELQKSEERYSRLSELTTEGVLISKNGIVIDSNKAFQDITGYSNEELIGKNIVELTVTKVHQKKVLEKIKNHIFTPYEIDIVRKDKKIIPIEIKANIVDYSFEGEIIKNARVTTINDISLRRLQELEIEKLTSAIEQSLTSIVITDIEGNIEYVNKYFTEITGYTKEEALGKNPSILKTDYLDNAVYKEMWETITSGKTWNGEFHNKKKNGEFYWEKAVISPIKDNYGEIVNYVAIKEDITEWKKTESERMFFENLVSASVNEIYIFDKETMKFSFINESAEKNIGYNLEEIKELTPIDLKPEITLNRFRELISPILNGKVNSVRFETIHIRKDGSTYPVDVSIQLVSHSNINKFVGIIVDVTKRREAEKELEEYRTSLEDKIKERTEEISVINEVLKKEIIKKNIAEKRVTEALIKERELNQLKDRFMSTVSHDLRTPIAAIISSVELIERFSSKWDKETFFRKIEQVKTSAERITDMLSHVLTLSKVDRNSISINYKMVNLKNEFQKIVDEIILTKDEDQQVIYKYNLKKENYKVDIDLLREILTNILSNSIKYSSDRGIVEFLATNEEDYLILQITDNGIGISEEELDKIFEDFYRAKINQNISGSGLGLSIVKHYVDMYKGKIKVESELGKGTIFKVKLPMSID